MPVTLKSRLREIERRMPQRVNRQVREAAGRMARKAAAGAPEETGSLKSSIKAQRVEDPDWLHGADYAFGVYANYYYIFREWGTASGEAAHPFMTPAAESERAPFARNVAQALKSL